MSGEGGAEEQLSSAHRVLVRNAGKAGGRLDRAIEALERAQNEAAEAATELERTARELSEGPRNLEEIEERLFALRAAARKHNTDVASLPALLERFMSELAEIDSSDQKIVELENALTAARASYEVAARRLSEKRRKAARGLDKAVMAELAPLRLEKAVFKTDLTELREDRWNAAGIDEVEFVVATNPGLSPGPMARIASGGELSRFMLALKLSLSASNADQTLIFDEVDSGIGGATAAAVGERLHRLADGRQVLVVTHSPQVAARGVHHLRVAKGEAGKGASKATVTRVEMLAGPDRQEEIARMLAGAQITDEARAAAASLIEGRS
jgi:DNA repair protein RecN (Recombination protein N)